VDLLEGTAQFRGLKVDDRVERDDCSELTVLCRQFEEVPFAELDRAIVKTCGSRSSRRLRVGPDRRVVRRACR
jgi:hypothetical protein